MRTQYRSEAMAASHETLQALQDADAAGKQTMRRFGEACLTPVRELAPGQIRAIRERGSVSQPGFADYLNATTSLVSKWERSEKRPSVPAFKLLLLVDKHRIGRVA